MRLPVACHDFELFWRYVVKTTDQETLGREAGVSRKELSERFSWFLALPPSPELMWHFFPPHCLQSTSPWVYGYDAKWLGRSPALLIHRDITHKETLWWSVAKHESMAGVRADLIGLSRYLDYHPPLGAVSDGKPGITSTIKWFFHLDQCQRCLVHVERDLKLYLPLHSPLAATQALRNIALSLIRVNSVEDKDIYLSVSEAWHCRYGHLLKTKTYPLPGSGVKRRWWYTHGNLRRAWRLMTKEPDSLFNFLTHPLIPKTNNSLEGINRHLNRRIGTKKNKQVALMMWQLAFSRTKSRYQRNKLWAAWKQQL